LIFLSEEKLVLFKERKQELVRVYQYISIIYLLIFLQIEEVKTKETYAIAKNLLEKYGETITPVINGNNKGTKNKTTFRPWKYFSFIIDVRQRASINPTAAGINYFFLEKKNR
jgi:hypothetical protein